MNKETLKTSSTMNIEELVGEMLKVHAKSVCADLLVFDTEVSITITIDKINFEEVNAVTKEELETSLKELDS